MGNDEQRVARVLRGDIWLAQLDPVQGHETGKIRPSIIIQNNKGNIYSPTTIVAPLTTRKLETIHPFEAAVRLGGVPGKILLNQIRAIDKTRLLKHLGRADKQTMRAVDEAIKISLGLV